MSSIGKKIEENIQLQEFVERSLAIVFELVKSDDIVIEMVEEICEEMDITMDEMWWMFEQLGYEREEE